jgi:hypothetical protein
VEEGLPVEKPAVEVLDREYSVHRFPPNTPIPPSVYQGTFYWVGKTDEELSIVCDSSMELEDEGEGVIRNSGWSCFKVQGPIDFSVSGILADFSSALTAARISILALCTFDTDYFLVKTVDLERAVIVLRQKGYEVRNF